VSINAKQLIKYIYSDYS